MAGNLEELAERLDRPVDAWPALAELSEEDTGKLGQAIDAACARQSLAVDEAIGRFFPPFLRGFVIRRLRGKRA